MVYNNYRGLPGIGGVWLQGERGVLVRREGGGAGEGGGERGGEGRGRGRGGRKGGGGGRV